MRTKINSIITFVSIATIAAGLANGQNEFNLSDIAPANVDLQRSNQPAVNSLGNQLPPVQNSLQGPASAQPTPASHSSIFDNNLRGGENQIPQSQPQAPQAQPRYEGGFASQPTPPTPSTNAISNGYSQNPSQNPLQALDPARLPQASGPVSQAPTNESFVKPADVETRQFSASSIPTSSPSTRRSIMNPISSSNDEPNIIVAAGFENEEQSRNTRTRGARSRKTAKSIMAQYSIANSNQALPGVPTSLEDMLRTTDTGSRMNMVQKYWETYFDWATLQNRQQYENWLNKLPTKRVQTDQLLLQTAKSMAKNETLAAEIQLARSQSVLQEISRSNPNEMLPLPLNDPVTSKYITHYDWYATRQMVPPKLKGINEILPRTFQLLTQRAATVGQAEQARDQAQSAYSSGQAGMASVLESGRAWQSGLQSLVATVVSYNKSISDYALTIAPQQKSVSEIASMLVSKPKAISAANMPTPVSRSNVANNQPYGQPARQSVRSNVSSNVRSTGPRAIGPNAGVFRKSQASQQPPVSSTPSQFNGGNSLSNPTNRPTNPNSNSGFRPPARDFGNPTGAQRQQDVQPGSSSYGNFGDTRSAVQSVTQGSNPLTPSSQPGTAPQFRGGATTNSFNNTSPPAQPAGARAGDGNSQMFGRGGGAFGG